MVNKRLEKYAVFSEGFRGMPDGWFNIRSCNFLVGENSTGKSSFLKLIDLIDSRQHMVYFELVGVIDGLETDTDICSRLTGAKSVTIGFLIKEKSADAATSEAPKEAASDPYLGRLVTYRSSDRGLAIDKVTILAGDKLLRLRQTKGGIHHRLDEFNYDETKSHKENGARFTKAHFASARFKPTFDEVDTGVPEVSQWLEAIRVAVASASKKRNSAFFKRYPPLNCVHYGPMRAKTRRLYHGHRNEFSSSGEHIAYVMREFLYLHDDIRGAIEAFGEESGLFDEISVSSVKTKIQDKPFAIEIKKAGRFYYVDELGYGVGQILPIIADIAFTRGENSFLIQQPELHLHPRAQAALGDVFAAACKKGAALVIETHSDFIIDRFRMKLRESGFDKRAQIVYFEKSSEGKNEAFEIEIFSDGTLEDVPEGYRSFFLNESIDKIEKLL